MKRRTLFLLPVFLLFLALLAPGGAVAATCPTDATGVLEKSTYRIGELIDFYGTYTDFADPGTVTIRFDRPADGTTRTFTAANVADGSWFRNVTFTSRRDAGAWRVHVVVEQTSGVSTCDDRFTLVTSSGANPVVTPPNTSMDARVPNGGTDATPTLAVLAGLVAFAVCCARSGRRRPSRRAI